MRVLVVDHDKFVRTIYQSELHQQNITVDLAGDGAEALEMIRKNKPDLVVLELVLPRMNGFDFLAELRKDKKLKDIKVLVCTILGQKKDMDEVVSFGVAKYLRKEDYSHKQVIEEILNILVAS